MSPELSAMKVCVESLEPLSDEEVRRALEWLQDYFDARRLSRIKAPHLPRPSEVDPTK